MFKIDDTIIYGATGVCRVCDITESKIAGVRRTYYILKPVDTDKSVIYVPIDNDNLVSRMRAIRNENQIRELIKRLKDQTLDWIDDNNRRNESYRAMLCDGKTEEIIRLIRTLHLRLLEAEKIGRHLSKSDEHIYKEAKRLLYNEVSNIMAITPDELLELVMQ